MYNNEKLEEWNLLYENKSLNEIINFVFKQFKSDVTLACSLGVEDSILLHEVVAVSKDIPIFVLDTGRLHESSYETLEACRDRYNININLYFPVADKVEELVKNKGAYSFYKSLENRKECCNIRKVEPLKRALLNKKAWITGLRKEQSVTRTDNKMFEYDTAHNLIKINPLINWDWQQILDYAKKNKVVMHPLHNKGYPSIGCEPCTRAINSGESLRAGRWWWEDESNKECGLHIKK